MPEISLRELLRPGKWSGAIRRRWFRMRLKRAIPLRSHPDVAKLGSDYGGWMVPVAEVQRDWIVYGFGAGTDVTFECGLITAAGCEVHVFDPTPGAVAHVAGLNQPGLHMHPWALWWTDEEIEMYLPRAGSGSLSAVNLQDTNEQVLLPARSLLSIMSELDHDHVDLLKIDIEGAEYNVLSPELLLQAGVRVLAIDLHPNLPPRRAIAFMKDVLAAGFKPVALEETDFTLVRTP